MNRKSHRSILVCFAEVEWLTTTKSKITETDFEITDFEIIDVFLLGQTFHQQQRVRH